MSFSYAAAADSGRAFFIWLPLLVLGGVLCWLLVPLGFPFEQVSGSEFRAALSVAYLSAAGVLLLLLTVTGTFRPVRGKPKIRVMTLGANHSPQ